MAYRYAQTGCLYACQIGHEQPFSKKTAKLPCLYHRFDCQWGGVILYRVGSIPIEDLRLFAADFKRVPIALSRSVLLNSLNTYRSEASKTTIVCPRTTGTVTSAYPWP